MGETSCSILDFKGEFFLDGSTFRGRPGFRFGCLTSDWTGNEIKLSLPEEMRTRIPGFDRAAFRGRPALLVGEASEEGISTNCQSGE